MTYFGSISMTTTMPRKRITAALDINVIEAMKAAAKTANTSMSRYIESVLMDDAKQQSLLPDDYEPLGETRGGDRSQSKNKDAK